MRTYGIALFVLFALSQLLVGVDFRSTKGGFQASFPGEVEEVVVDQYSSAWTSFDFIDEIFVMHQVAVLRERPSGPLQYNSHEEYRAFFNQYLKELTQSYSKPRIISSEYMLWNNKYPAIKYTFQGVMVGYDIEVINEGLALLYNRKLVKSAIIFPTILKDEPRLVRMVKSFHSSLIVL